MFDSLGIDPRRATHVRHRVRHPLGTLAYATTRQMRLQTTLSHAFAVTDTSALVLLHTKVSNSAAQPVLVAEDGFLVDALPAADVARAELNTRLARELVFMPRRSASLSAERPGTVVQALSIGADWCHRHRALMGAKEPFAGPARVVRWLQGAGVHRPTGLPSMALRDLVLRHLADTGAAVERVSFNFVRPALTGESLRLSVENGRFELVRASGVLLAWGEASE